MEGTNTSDVFEVRLEPVPLSIYLFAHASIISLGIFGNLVVIHTIYTRCKRTPNTIFLCSLAFTDLFTAILAVPPWLYARVVVSPMTCLSQYRTLFFAPVFIFCATSVVHLAIITVDRFIAVSYPLKYHLIMRKSRCTAIIISAWLFSIVFGVIPIIGSLIDPDQWVCGTVNYAAGAATVHLVLVAGGPPVITVILLLLYVRIFRIANRHLKKVSETRAPGMSSERIQQLETESRMRTTITAVLVVTVFGICWLPVSIKTIVDSFVEPSDSVQFAYQSVSEFFSIANSALNPIIYAMRYQKFRSTYLFMLRAVCPSLLNKSGRESVTHVTGVASYTNK